MPLGDEKAQHWISNWMLYQSAHQTMASGWKKWVWPLGEEVPPRDVARGDERNPGSVSDLIGGRGRDGHGSEEPRPPHSF